MKATGIVRRIDDLGRVVIPKEIRRTMRIREGDPLEIYTDSDGGVIFKKYSPIGDLSGVAVQYADALSKHTQFGVVICDRDHCIAVAGCPKREILDRRVTSALEDVIDNRKQYVFSNSAKPLIALEGIDKKAVVISPIISAGDISGAVILLQNEDNQMPNETDIKLTQVAAVFLAKQMEE